MKRKRILTLLKTIPSSSHNSFYSDELGQHWPAGTRFKRLSKFSQRYWQRYCGGNQPGGDYANYVFVEQIGGEEVVLMVPKNKMQEWFGAN